MRSGWRTYPRALSALASGTQSPVLQQTPQCLSPRGGTWAWFGFYLSATGAMSGVAGGVDPGETEVLPAAADLIGSVLCWRVA